MTSRSLCVSRPDTGEKARCQRLAWASGTWQCVEYRTMLPSFGDAKTCAWRCAQCVSQKGDQIPGDKAARAA